MQVTKEEERNSQKEESVHKTMKCKKKTSKTNLLGFNSSYRQKHIKLMMPFRNEYLSEIRWSFKVKRILTTM